MSKKILFVAAFILILGGGAYWWSSTAPQRAARPNPDYTAPEVKVVSEEEVRRAAEATGATSSPANPTTASQEDIEAAAKPR